MDSNTNSSLRHIIDQWLFEADLRQGQLARRARISEATLARVKAGKQRAGTRVLHRLEMAMSLPAGTLTALQDQLELGAQEKEA
jgi:transcriptional regulator with XRE-family HTH domain